MKNLRFSYLFLNIIKLYKMGKSNEDSQIKIGDKQLNIFGKIKQFLFLRNYMLVTSLKISFLQAIILIMIEQSQKIAIFVRYSVNPNLQSSPQMYYIDQFSRILLLDFFLVEERQNLILTILLIFAQILIILVIVIPIKGEIVRQILSKYIITFLQMTLTFPSIILSLNSMIKGANVIPNVALYIMTITTNLIYESMQLECSFQRQNSNVFIRTARPITMKIINLIFTSSFPILTHYLFPNSFAIYSFGMLLLQIYNWIYYLFKFIYFHEVLIHLRGIMLTVSISSNLCFLIIFVLNNAIISQNILLFITTFSIFLGNFFITYRKYILNNIVINKDLKGENQIGMYGVFYWHCFSKITEKKNQLYISSLLKNHTNQCDDPSCCCKNRQNLYDTYLKTFGNPKIQPHFDRIFIRHFIRKLIFDGYSKFSKSSILAMLLSNYNIEVVEMITQTMELIRKLSKMEQKNKLYFTEQFLLFCLKMKTRDKIINISLKLGNVDLQSVKQFDQQLITLNDHLKNSVKMYYNLWKQLQSSRINESVLYQVCKNNLELMFKIQQNYKSLKNINTESSQLKAIMLFYSKLILHDIHLLSQVRKDIKGSHQRNNILSSLDISSLQLFGNKTVTMISLENSKIKWSSKNAHSIFEYTKEEFHNVTIKNLMPKHFADRHDSYIQKWKETGHHIKLNKATYLWGSSKNGNCFSMLMFVKVIPLIHEQEHAFFSCIQKLDEQSEIVCSSFGQVYGVGKSFSKLINMNPKFMQQIKMNIQVFIPYTFDYFLEYFYPQNSKLKMIKKDSEVRRQGYFPDNLDIILKDLSQQRKIFLKKNEKNGFTTKQHLNFIRQQMQQLTCNVNGEYISLSVLPFKIFNFLRESENVIVFKISNPKKDTIEKYYSQLQRMINKLQILQDQQNSKSKKSLMRKSKKQDFFKVFLKPKRIKILLEQQQEQFKLHGQMTSISREMETMKKTKPRQSVLAHRKKLAVGAKLQIKNERVRYNLFKIKRLLFQQGVISRYTYNLLIGKHNNMKSQSHVEEVKHALTSYTLKEVEDDRNVSDDEKDSFDHDSEGELAANKQNDNETFNSASSSATFISMTNHVKLFKLKLRSLNTPRPLLILNVIIVVTLLIEIFFYIYLNSLNVTNLKIGINEFENNQQANLILDSLLLGQMNTYNIQNNPNNTYYQTQRTYFLSTVTTMYKNQMFLRAQYKQIDPLILSYLSLTVEDVQILTVLQFIELILDQLISDNFSHVMRYFVQSIAAIAKHSSSNIFFDRIEEYAFFSFVISLAVVIILLIITIPIVYKLKIKIKQIYDLLSKISSNEKIKYFNHFTSLHDQFKSQEVIEYNKLNNLTTAFQNKLRFKSNTKALSEDELKIEAQEKNVRTQEQQSSITTDKSIYIKIASIYFILISSILFNYIYLINYHHSFMKVNNVFISLFNSKTLLTSRIVEANFQIMNYRHQYDYTCTEIQLVGQIYDTYHISGISQHYKAYVFNFTTMDPCHLISNILRTEEQALCHAINNNTFAQGGLDNLYYTHRKSVQRLNEYYASKNYAPNVEDNLTIYPPYFKTEEYKQLNIGYFYSTLMIYDLYKQIYNQISIFANNYRFQFYVSLAVCLTLIILFIISWVFVYLKLAQNASYINAFLLLIPFEVLSENPYIKLYIKNEFDYKTSY